MKKKITQWLIGLLYSILGFGTCYLGIFATLNFVSMMNTIGKEFVGYFIWFIFSLSLFLFLPYICFKLIEDGVQDKWK